MTNEFHPLTVEVKDFFAKNQNNDFVARIKKVADIEKIEVFADEPDDEEVIIIFETTDDRDLSCIVFSDGVAWVEFERWKCFFVVPFYYSHQDDKQSHLKKRVLCHDAHSIYDNYEAKGLQKLLDDVACLIENTVAKKLSIEYMGKLEHGKWRIVQHPSTTIACSFGWKEKYLHHKKLVCKPIIY